MKLFKKIFSGFKEVLKPFSYLFIFCTIFAFLVPFWNFNFDHRFLKAFTADNLEITTQNAISTSHYNFRRIPVISSCSSRFFSRLKNLVGSIHYWEPELQVYFRSILSLCIPKVSNGKR